MAAAAAPLAQVAVQFGRDRANTCRVKQREQLDVALLCSKLEAHRREQEASRRRQQEQEAAQRKLFVPRSAARQFAATATPLNDDLDPNRLRWNSKDEAADSNEVNGALHLNPKQKYAALRMGMTESEAIAAATAMHNPTLHHLPPSRVRIETQKGTERKLATQRKAASGDLPSESASEDVDTSAGFYRPGDSARRRMLFERQQDQTSPRGGSFDIAMIATIPAYRHGRDEPNEMPYDMPMPNRGDESSSAATRPKLNPHDRHNWAQQSQCGDDFRRTLHLPLLHRRNKAEEPDSKRCSSSGTMGRSTELRRASDSLITDAAKLVKREEKRKRHENFKAFFRRS